MSPRALGGKRMVSYCKRIVIFWGIGWSLWHGSEAYGHKAHAHGQGQLNWVLEESSLVMRWTLPAQDIVGFEHSPRNKKQSQVAQKIKIQLQLPQTLVSLEPNCEFKSVDVKGRVLGEQGGTTHKHEGTTHEPGEVTQVTAPLEQHHSHKKSHNPAKDHSDIEIELHGICPQPPKKVTIRIFDHFKSLKRLDVQYINGEEQGQARLTPRNSSVEFK